MNAHTAYRLLRLIFPRIHFSLFVQRLKENDWLIHWLFLLLWLGNIPVNNMTIHPYVYETEIVSRLKVITSFNHDFITRCALTISGLKYKFKSSNNLPQFQ